MTVRELLAREHAMFRRLLDTLEFDLSHPQPRARAEISSALRTLLPSLDRHEELEEIVFEETGERDDGGVDKMRAQHHAIGALRGEILYALEMEERCPFERMLTLTRFLILNLRAHLDAEETLVWPRHEARLSRSLDGDLADPVHRRALAVERQLRRGLASIAASFR